MKIKSILLFCAVALSCGLLGCANTPENDTLCEEVSFSPLRGDLPENEEVRNEFHQEKSFPTEMEQFKF